MPKTVWREVSVSVPLGVSLSMNGEEGALS